MHKKLIYTAISAFGFGVLASWAVTADIYENRRLADQEAFDKIFKEKTEHIWALQDRIDYIKKLNSVTNNTEVHESEEIQKAPVDIDSENQTTFLTIIDDVYSDNLEDEIIPKGETLEETRSNLQNIINTYTYDNDSQEKVDRFLDQVVDNDNSPPFVISRDDYAYDEEGESFDKITITYYPRERVLLDDDEDPIDDPPRTIGWRNLTQFGGESGDPDVVFVRNRRLRTDFEVVKEEGVRLPLHIQYGMEKEEFRVNKAAGLIKLRREDE